MPKCPLTYEIVSEGRYAAAGLKRLAPKLSRLEDLPFDAESLRQEAVLRAGKMSVQGVQPKLSGLLNVPAGRFEIVDAGGRYILKPPSALYPALPENEDLTMRLAAFVGIEVPVHGLIHAQDGSLVYVIRRFDREGRAKRLQVEDFAQLAGKSRDTKYDFSMERLVPLIEEFCTFPAVEKEKLFRRTIFNFLVGNEDMHLKNFSLIVRGEVTTMAPAYDFLNTSIVLRDPEELALPLRGKKRGVTRALLVDYYGRERLGLPSGVIDDTLAVFTKAKTAWMSWIEKSFLSPELKDAYRALVAQRWDILGI